MKQLIVRLGLALTLVGSLLTIAAPVASANCGVPSGDYVSFYRDSGSLSGNPVRHYCQGQADLDMAKEPSTSIMGPLWDGLYKDDWEDCCDWASGITTVKNNGTQKICMYFGANFDPGTYMGQVSAGNLVTIVLQNDRLRSFYWKASGACNGA